METLLMVLLALQDGQMVGMRLSILPQRQTQPSATKPSDVVSSLWGGGGGGFTFTIAITIVFANLIICIKRVFSE